MSTFLTGKALEEKLTDIIWEAKKYVVIISPYIKLDNHVKSIFEKIKSTHEVHIILIFGKNENQKQKSFNKSDYDYFKEFKNITILYNKDLHAKHYCNESEGLITSLNLYDYSMVNNIEYGVHFSRNLLNLTFKLFDDTYDFTSELIFDKSEVVFIRRPQYSNKLFGFKKEFQESKIIYDISKEFFNGYNYKVKYLNEFDYDDMTNVNKNFSEKPHREEKKVEKNSHNYKKSFEYNQNQNFNNFKPEYGYCIRTGEAMLFNYEKPMSYDAWLVWNQFGDYNFPENYCHKTGKKSYGKTSMAHPVL